MPKPVPTDAIVTSSHADELYDQEVESWGDGLFAAGVRLCAWYNAQGGEFDCPK